MQQINNSDVEELLEILMNCQSILDKIDIAMENDLRNIIKYVSRELQIHIFNDSHLTFSKFLEFKRFTINTQRALLSEYENME